MLKKVLSDSVVYGASRVLMMAVGMFLIPVYSRLFTTADYGIIETFNIFMSVALSILPCGMFQSIYRFVYESDDTSHHTLIYSSIANFLLAMSVAFILIMLIFRYQITDLLIQDTGYVSLYLLTLVIVTFSLFNAYNLEILRSQYKKYHYLTIAVGTGLVLATGGIYFVVVLKKGIYGFFYASVLAQGLFCFVGLFFNRRWLKFTFSPTLFKDLLNFGLPFIPAALSVLLMKFADRFFVQRMLGLNELGLYSMGVRISSIYDIVGTAFSLALFPHLMRVVHQAGSEAILKRFFIQSLFLLGFCLAVFSIASKPLLHLLVDKKFWECSSVIYIFVITSTCTYLNYILGLGISASKKTKFIFIPTILGGILNIVLCFYWVKPLGIFGAALSSLIGAIVYLLSSYVIAQRFYPIGYDMKKGSIITVGLLVWTGALYYLDDFVKLSPPAIMGIKLLLFAAAIGLAFGSGIVSLKQLQTLISPRAPAKNA